MFFRIKRNKSKRRIPKLGGGWDKLLYEIFNDSRYEQNGLYDLLNVKKDGGSNRCPKKRDVFRCFRYTPIRKVKCVFLGNDPYPTPGRADGLDFSMRDLNEYREAIGKSGNVSIKQIFKALKEDKTCTNKIDLTKFNPPSGNLKCWAKRGVLMLNHVLTIDSRTGNPGRVSNQYERMWNWFVEEVINRIAKYKNEKGEKCAFLFFGGTWTKNRNGGSFYNNFFQTNSNNHLFLIQHYYHPSCPRFINSLIPCNRIFSRTIDHLYPGRGSNPCNFDVLFPFPKLSAFERFFWFLKRMVRERKRRCPHK